MFICYVYCISLFKLRRYGFPGTKLYCSPSHFLYHYRFFYFLQESFHEVPKRSGHVIKKRSKQRRKDIKSFNCNRIQYNVRQFSDTFLIILWVKVAGYKYGNQSLADAMCHLFIKKTTR